MARLLYQTLARKPPVTSTLFPCATTTLCHQQRHRSNQSGKSQLPQLIEVDLESSASSSTSESASEGEVLGVHRLEEAINNIIVKRAAPDWLPFLPGSSYWVPPRPRPNVVDVIRKVTSAAATAAATAANQDANDDEAMSLTSAHCWPSSEFFIHGSAPTNRAPVELEVEVEIHDANDASQSENKEG